MSYSMYLASYMCKSRFQIDVSKLMLTFKIDNVVWCKRTRLYFACAGPLNL